MTEVKCGKKTNNPFFNFLRCYRTQAENKHKSAAELAVQGAREWNRLGEEQRKPFVEMAIPFLKPKKPRASRAKSTTRRRTGRSTTRRRTRTSTTRRRTRRSTTRRRTRRSTTRRTRRSTTRRTLKSIGRRGRTRSRRRTVKRRPSRRRTSRRRASSGRRKPVKSSRGRGRPRKKMACAKPFAMKLQSEQQCGPQAGTSTTTAPLTMHNSPLQNTTIPPLKESPETPPSQGCEFKSKVLAECEKAAPFPSSESKTEESSQCKSCNLSQNILVDRTGSRSGCSLVDDPRCPNCPRQNSSDEIDSTEMTITRKCAEMQKKYK